MSDGHLAADPVAGHLRQAVGRVGVVERVLAAGANEAVMVVGAARALVRGRSVRVLGVQRGRALNRHAACRDRRAGEDRRRDLDAEDFSEHVCNLRVSGLPSIGGRRPAVDGPGLSYQRPLKPGDPAFRSATGVARSEGK